MKIHERPTYQRTILELLSLKVGKAEQSLEKLNLIYGLEKKYLISGEVLNPGSESRVTKLVSQENFLLILFWTKSATEVRRISKWVSTLDFQNSYIYIYPYYLISHIALGPDKVIIESERKSSHVMRCIAAFTGWNECCTFSSTLASTHSSLFLFSFS